MMRGDNSEKFCGDCTFPLLAAATGGLALGGSSTFLVNLAHAFRMRSQSLQVVVLSEENAYAPEFASATAHVSAVSRRTKIYEDRLRLGYEAMAKEKPRAVLACLGVESFELLRLVPTGVLRLGIVQSHDPGPYEAVKTYAAHLDAVVGVSREVTRHLAGLSEVQQHNVRVEYIPYGIFFGPAPEPRSSGAAHPLRVIYVGRLIEVQKRISRIATLVRMSADAGLPIEFTIVGSGPDEAKTRQQLAGVPGVRFTGAVANEQVQALLREHDVFVLLSDFEGLPLSLLEAMGSGLIPLVSDLESGMREVVADDNGFRVPVGDVEAAFNVLASLARDRSRLPALSKAAMERARGDYSAQRMGDRYLALVESFAPPMLEWPRTVHVPVPYGMRPWLYQGPMRTVRRHVKRLLSALR